VSNFSREPSRKNAVAVTACRRCHAVKLTGKRVFHVEILIVNKVGGCADVYGEVHRMPSPSRQNVRREETMELTQNMTPLLKVSKEMGITPDKCRYWLSLLEAETEKIGKARFVRDENVVQLHQMARMVADGITPGESAKRTKTGPIDVALVPITATEKPLDLAPVAARMEGMEKAILALTETFRKEMKVMVEENRALCSEVSLLRGFLPALVEKPVVTEMAITPAPIRAVVTESSQRKITFLESVKLGIDDCFGLLFGRG